MSDKVIKIEKKMDSLHRMTLEKLDKHDKDKDNIMNILTNIHK